MTGQATASTPYFRIVLGGAATAGLSTEELLATVGVDAQTIEDPDARIPRETLYQLWREAARRSGDENFGLHVAEQTQPGAFALPDYAARNAPTLGEAFRRVVRYTRLVNTGAALSLYIEPEQARLVYGLPDEPGGAPRHTAEWLLATLLIAARQMTAQALLPLAVDFEHPDPPDTREHRRIFGCPVRFAQPANQIVFPRPAIDLPTTNADPRLCALLDRYAEELLSRLPQSELFVDRIRRLITEALRGGDPSLEAVAQRVHMSPRTLQRRLREDNTSHQELLDGLRCELAVKYLGERRMAISEAAFLLGFSEPSAFHRAFKRWTGKTPGEFRQSPA